MLRTQIIQSLIDKNGYKSYLEIGVQGGANFSDIKCEEKTGVDPDRTSKATIFQTSDLFFSLNLEKYDIIFIDGLHHHEQVEKDIVNSMKALSVNGTIIVHDCNPTSEIMQRVPRETKIWTGDGWKAWVKLRSEISGWDFYVIDTDYGVGVIQRNMFSKASKKIDNYSYAALNENREKLLNLISVNEFKLLYLD